MAEQRGVAVRALGFERLIPGHELAGGVFIAAVVHIAARGFLLDHLCAAHRAGRAGVLGDRLGVGALRETRAGEELAEPAGLDDHVAAALFADHVRDLVLDLDALALKIDLRLLECCLKPVIEVVQQLDIVQLARLDLVELLLHVGGELIVRDRLELVDQQAGHALTERRRAQRLVLLGHIVAVQNGRDGRRIGGRAADAALLHRADERGFGVARGRLGEVLRRVELLDRERVALVKARQRLARLALLLVVRALLVDRGKAREGHRMAGGAEHLSLAHNVRRNRIQNRVRHLARDKARPDQLIQLILVRREILTDLIRQQLNVRRADGFVRILRIALGLEHARLAGIELVAVAPADKARGGGGRLVSQTERVGTHIGDQTGQAVLAQLDAFVQLLRDAHRAARGHVELAAGFLLQGRGDERRRRAALFLAALDLAHGKRLAGNRVHDRLRLLLVFQLHLAGLVAVVARGELTAVRGLEQRLDRPVFLGHERADLVFAVHDQTGRDALHAARGQAALDLAPQEGRQLVAYDAVEDAARLLRVDQIDVNVARVVDAVFDRLLGDLVEGDALGILVPQLKQFLDVPRDRLALAVRVGCEVDEIAFADLAADLFDDFIFSLDRHIFRLEIVLNIDAHFLFRQIAQMPHRRLDHIVRPQVFADGLGLGRRLHDN